MDGEGNTRLVVRMRIEPPPGTENRMMMWFLDAGGFVMERRMFRGIKDRAEGKMEPPYIETVEIVLWVSALLEGLAAAYLFVFQEKWRLPLVLGIVAIVALLAFTFVQPTIWVRVLVVAGLLVGLVFLAVRDSRRSEDEVVVSSSTV